MNVKRRLAIVGVAWIVLPWTWAIVAEQRARRRGAPRGEGADG